MLPSPPSLQSRRVLGASGGVLCHFMNWHTGDSLGVVLGVMLAAVTSNLMTYYINRDAGRYRETVDEYETKAEALKVLPEYQLSEHGRAFYFISPACRANWESYAS